MSTVTGQQIVDRAKGNIGKHEEPMGSNTGTFVVLCQRATFLGGTGWPWCAAFVCRMAKACGVPLAYDGAGAHDLADHHKPWVSAANVEPGMVVDYNIGSGHTGIVASVNTRAGTLTSIDGNWADAVTEHVMPLSQVRAFWKIPGVSYATGPAPAPKPQRLPAWVVVTSANGHSKIVFRTAEKRHLVRWLTTHNLARLFPGGITIRRAKK
jgi:hypothetical protein